MDVDVWQDGSTAMSVAMEAGNSDVGVLLYAHEERLKSASSVPRCYLLFIYLFIYYTVYAHVKSFTIVKNRSVDKSRVTAGKHDRTEQI